MKRREAIQPPTECDVLLQQVRNLQTRIKRLSQAQTSVLQHDSYTKIVDPLPFELFVNGDGTHIPASDTDAMMYYHPGEENDTGPLVDAEFKAVSSGADIAGWIWAAADVGGSLGPNHLTDGLVGRDIGSWYQISYGGPGWTPLPATANTDGPPFKHVGGIDSRVIVCTTMVIPSGLSFDLRILPNSGQVSENGVADVFVSPMPSSIFKTSQWSGSFTPGILQSFANYVVHNPVDFLVYLDNLTGSTQSIPSGSEIHMMGVRLGGYSLPVEENFP